MTADKLQTRLLVTTLLLSVALVGLLIGGVVAYVDLASHLGDLQVENSRLHKRLEAQTARLDEAEQRMEAANRYALETRRYLNARGYAAYGSPSTARPAAGVSGLLQRERNNAGLNVSEDDAGAIVTLLRKALLGF